jgi:hypothetical protein
MKTHCIPQFLPAVVVVLSLLLAGKTALATPKAEHHHDAKGLVGANIKHDGHHDIDHKGKYTSSVEVSHAKIASFHVKNTDKGNIAVKKYKTNRKLAQSASAHIVYAALAQDQMQDMGTVYIGYAYTDEYGNEEIYWFPEEMIEDLDTGAVEYVASS